MKKVITKGVADLIKAHRPLSLLQRIQLTAKQGLSCITDYKDGNHYAAFTDLTSYNTLTHIHQRMLSDSTGERILKQKPRVTDQLLESLKQLPENTLGKKYYQFMSANGFKPSQRPLARYIPDIQLAYVSQRYKQIHDFLHVLLFKQISVNEEILVKWFQMVQLNLPSAAMAALVTPILSPQIQFKQLAQIINKAQKCTFVLNIYFEQHLEKDLTIFREQLKI